MKKSEVSITDYENLKNGVDWFPAFQAALTAIGNTGSIKFPGKTVYNMSAPLVFPLQGYGIKLFSNDGATIKATHNGDCVDLTAQNENFSAHSIEGIILQGPNTSYPASDYVPPSIGAGVRMVSSYGCVLRDVIIQGFKYGQYLKTGIKNSVEGKSYIRFNQYGVYIDGGATNANYWAPSVRVRENRKAGVYFNTGLAPFPTHNIFECLIESNIPYPYAPGGNAPNDSIGVYLGGAYYNIFNNIYSENHQYAVWITGSSDGNKFNKLRCSPSGDLSRLDKIMFDGVGVNNNTFTECVAISQDNTSPNVESNNANQFYNQFINCEGFTFIPASILAPIDIINNRPNQAGWGTPFGGIARPYHGYLSNPGEGTARGTISGIGTTNAVLNADGYGEVILQSLITAPTTITNITKLRPGQFFVLSNHQEAYPVTLKATTDGITGLILKNRGDAILSKYSHSIVFYVTQLGKVIEVGRNFSAAMPTTINSYPTYIGEVLVIGTNIYVAYGIGYGNWKQVTTV